MTIQAVRESIADGSVEAVLQAHLDAVQADETNSFTAVIPEPGEPADGPLHGVPVAIKDLIDQKGQITTAGSSFYRLQPDRSAPVVERLEAAGASIIGRTGLHEFAYGFSSENHWFGPVKNPWDLTLSPGGSSGGSAAAVAAGLVPVSIGTDTGGSVRVPAALCGIYGLKVTHGRVPISGVLPLAESLDTVGPFARCASDLETVYDVIAGFDAADPWSIDSTDPEPVSGPLRIGIPNAWLDAVPTDAAVREGFDRLVDALSDAGHTIVELDLPDLVPGPHVVTLSAAEAASVHRPWFTDLDKHYGPDVEERLAAAMEVTVDQLVDAKRWQARIVQLVRTAFSTCDVMLTPTVGATRKAIGVEEIVVNGTPEFYRPVLAGFTALVNQFGCPAIALPLTAPGSPPPSVQFIGPWRHERTLLGLARALESAELVGYRPPGSA